MKKLIPVFVVVAAIVFSSCNSNTTTEDHSKMNNNDSLPMQPVAVDNDVKIVPVSFASVDPGVTSFMKVMVQNYLAVKNALADNNESDAASASDKMVTAMKSFDKSLLSADQKKVYDDVQDDLKEHAEHIAKNKLDHQRSHFSMMSEDMYNLVKAYGAGMNLYHDHCPMYNDNIGAMWLSETKEIRNPYYGEKMMTCGSVEGMFK